MRFRKALAPAFLLILFGLLVHRSSINNSVTVDESAHLPLGLCYLQTGNPGYALMHGPLAQVLSASGLLAHPEVRCNFPLPHQDTDFWIAASSFQEQNPARYLELFRLARIPILILALLLGLLVYLFTRRRRDRLTALLALFLFALCPNLIAHSGLATTDLAVTAFALAFVAALWFYLQAPSGARLVLAGAALGLAILSKYTAGLFAFLAPILIAFGVPKTQPRLPPSLALGKNHGLAETLIATLGLGLVAWVTLILGYHHDLCFEPLGAFTFKSAFWQSLQAGLPARLPVPFPHQFIVGLDLQSFDVSRPWPLYLFGRLSAHGWLYYQLMILLYKLPLALLIALALGLLQLCHPKRDQLWTLFPALAWIAALSLLGTSQFGIRLLLPAIPFLHLFAAENLARLLRRSCLYKALALVLILCYAAGAWHARPFFISYFNELAGGPRNPNRGHQVALDSNLDWDQDWFRFKLEQDQHGWQPLHYAQFGVISPEVYGVQGRPLGCDPVSGYVAVSVNLIFGLDPVHQQAHCYSWLRFKEPIAKIGSSIWVYHFGP